MEDVVSFAAELELLSTQLDAHTQRSRALAAALTAAKAQSLPGVWNKAAVPEAFRPKPFDTFAMGGLLERCAAGRERIAVEEVDARLTLQNAAEEVLLRQEAVELQTRQAELSPSGDALSCAASSDSRGSQACDWFFSDSETESLPGEPSWDDGARGGCDVNTTVELWEERLGLFRPRRAKGLKNRLGNPWAGTRRSSIMTTSLKTLRCARSKKLAGNAIEVARNDKLFA